MLHFSVFFCDQQSLLSVASLHLDSWRSECFHISRRDSTCCFVSGVPPSSALQLHACICGECGSTLRLKGVGTNAGIHTAASQCSHFVFVLMQRHDACPCTLWCLTPATRMPCRYHFPLSDTSNSSTIFTLVWNSLDRLERSRRVPVQEGLCIR